MFSENQDGMGESESKELIKKIRRKREFQKTLGPRGGTLARDPKALPGPLKLPSGWRHAGTVGNRKAAGNLWITKAGVICPLEHQGRTQWTKLKVEIL